MKDNKTSSRQDHIFTYLEKKCLQKTSRLSSQALHLLFFSAVSLIDFIFGS